MQLIYSWLESQPIIMRGVFGGLVITALNTLGACLILFWKNPSQKLLDAALGFAAGVMLTASYTSLIIPGIEAGGVIRVIIGIILGVIVLDFADNTLPHLHPFKGRQGLGKDLRIRRVWLMIFAITFHNMPEGLAVGIGFGSGNISTAVTLMLAIGIQNIPEGFAVSIAALNTGKSARFYAMLTGIRAGLVEMPIAILGAWAVGFSSSLLPYGMGFAAGAMLYVISDEIVPETHRAGHERVATLGLMIGLITMLYLDIILG